MPLLILGGTCLYTINLFKRMNNMWKLVATKVVEVSRCLIKLLMFTIQTVQAIPSSSSSLKPKIIEAISWTSKGSSKHGMDVRVATILWEYCLIDFRSDQCWMPYKNQLFDCKWKDYFLFKLLSEKVYELLKQ